ncbi:hypothetical protein, partial [Kitasatospora sp. NPDC088134]|uniref:hypothetical protein n=1 Tax=Kitasatospora sp. NPDC088134 TaxID=3364071 RepID=UPI003800BC4A
MSLHRRVEQLLGAALENLRFDDIVSLIGNTAAAEAQDLDYKAELGAPRGAEQPYGGGRPSSRGCRSSRVEAGGSL